MLHLTSGLRKNTTINDVKQEAAEKASSGVLGPETSGKRLKNSTRKTVSRSVISLLFFCLFLNCVVFETEYVTLDHKTSLKSLGYICSNNQKYIAWVKITDFSFMPKIIRTLSKDHVP